MGMKPKWDEVPTESSHGFRYFRTPSGKLFWFSDARHKAKLDCYSFARNISRALKLRDKSEDNEKYGDLEQIGWTLDEMESYINHVRKYIDELRGVSTVEARIALLRNTAGRTPEEAEAFLAKAAELERGLQ